MTIEIEIRIRAAQIVLSDGAAGNLRALGGTDIVFTTNDPNREFTLDFFTLALEGDNSPFECGANCGKVAKGKPFRATLRRRGDQKDLGAYKYSVSTGSLVLDPVIILENV
jgi:hypothetical protein